MGKSAKWNGPRSAPENSPIKKHISKQTPNHISWISGGLTPAGVPPSRGSHQQPASLPPDLKNTSPKFGSVWDPETVCGIAGFPVSGVPCLSQMRRSATVRNERKERLTQARNPNTYLSTDPVLKITMTTAKMKSSFSEKHSLTSLRPCPGRGHFQEEPQGPERLSASARTFSPRWPAPMSAECEL